MDKVRVAVIGCGGISRAHLNAHVATPQSQVVYCVDINEKAAREKAEVLKCKWHTDYRAVLAEVDAVDICTPPHLHAEMTIAAARAGKHVLCEKVMATNLGDAETMIRETDKAGVVFMVAFVLRYRPEFQALHEICASGRLGRIFEAYVQTSMNLGRAAEWRKSVDTFPMGCFLSHGCHYVDQLIWNVGEITQAAALGNRFTFGTVIPGGDDTSVAIFRHGNGAVSTYCESWAIPNPITTLRFDAYGTDGSVRLEYLKGGVRAVDLFCGGKQERVFEADTSSWKHDDPFSGSKDMYGQIQHFIGCIVDRKRPLTHGKEGIKSMQAILAADHGQETSTIVSLREWLQARR